MSAGSEVYHILTVTGFSKNSFDEAAANAVKGGWDNHHHEFEEFVSYEVVKLGGNIEMGGEGKDKHPIVFYSATVAISAIHSDHGH